MRRMFFRLTAFFLIFALSTGSLFAQTYEELEKAYEKQMELRPGSFRSPADREKNKKIPEQQQESISKGMILTEPSVAGLTYQVHVLGEVENPGTYRIMASERLAEVLSRAGGVLQHGSERGIEIRREGKIYKVIDIIKFKLQGSLDNNPYLLDNDVVYIPLKTKTIQVVGAVKRPGQYELSGEKKLSDVIRLAGDFSTGVAEAESVKIIRFVDGKKEVLEVNQSKDALSSFEVRNGDVIYVPNVITAGHKFDYDIAKLPGDNVFYPSYEDRVFVLGGVSAPGAYPFSPYYSLHQYISLAGGYTKLSTGKISILTSKGKKIRCNKRKPLTINPGDTILVGERRIPPEGWVNLFMSLGSFGLSTTATVLTLTNR